MVERVSAHRGLPKPFKLGLSGGQKLQGIEGGAAGECSKKKLRGAANGQRGGDLRRKRSTGKIKSGGPKVPTQGRIRMNGGERGKTVCMRSGKTEI